MSGFCRYGDRCNYDHPTGSQAYTTSNQPNVGRSIFLRSTSNQGNAFPSTVNSVFGNSSVVNQPQNFAANSSISNPVFGKNPVFPNPNSSGQQSQVSSVFGKPAPSSFAQTSNVTPLKKDIDLSTHSAFPNFTSTPYFGNKTSVFGTSNSTVPAAAPVQAPVTGNVTVTTSDISSKCVQGGTESKRVESSLPRTNELTDSKATVANTKMLFGKVVGEGQQSIKHAMTFSLVENLSADEMKAFESDSFELGSIPLNPPPIHLC